MGIDPSDLGDLAAADIEAAYRAQVVEALAAGAFGVPTFVTGDGTLFFGQDRLPLLADHLSAIR